jgi:hypothetical protein
MSSPQSSSLLDDADGFVREYLLWRGFYTSLQSFNADSKDDSLMGLSSRRLVQKLAGDVDALRLQCIFTWWDEGIGPLLSRVDDEVAAVGRSLRDSTYRWYLIGCFKQQQSDLILNFFKGEFANLISYEMLTPMIRPLVEPNWKLSIQRRMEEAMVLSALHSKS